VGDDAVARGAAGGAGGAERRERRESKEVWHMTGWLSRLGGLRDHLRLDVLMRFEVMKGQGAAALRWSVIDPHPSLSEAQCRVALVGLLYARTLVNHAETRAELFDRMGTAAQQVLAGSTRIAFEPWALHVAGREFFIWPWTMTQAERLSDAKAYVATLQGTARGGLGIHLKMALWQERILTPASALIAASELSAALNAQEQRRLASVLRGINEHYRLPENIRMMSEPAALAATMPALLA
jgi:hypothetical protein